MNVSINKTDYKATNNIRRLIVDIGFKCGQSAHFGGGLSLVEILHVLYSDFLRISPKPKPEIDRDIFVLSKGHGVLGLYAVLHVFGFISKDVLYTFQKNGSPLIAHPIKNVIMGIESSNGSLGQGLSFLAGAALASKLRGENRRFVTVMGDGECNEGSVWEAAMFCNQFKLNNLVAIVDNNGFQNDDSVCNVSAQQNVLSRWSAFGWKVLEVNGHCCESLRNTFQEAFDWKSGPCVVVANTNKGSGISFMENNNDWHHNRLTLKNYELAMTELRAHD